MPLTARRNRYILTVVCNTTGWVELLALRNCKAQTVADELLRLFCSKGLPTTIRSDNFLSFRSEILTAVREKLQINMKTSAPYHAQSHGRVEVTHKTAMNML